MVIRSVDHRDADRFARELLGGLESAKPGADDYNARLRCRRVLHMTIFSQLDAAKAPNSKYQIPGKLQTSKTKKRTVVRFGLWDLELLWSLVFGVWSFGRRTIAQKTFVIVRAVIIFRASCRSQFLAVKH